MTSKILAICLPLAMIQLFLKQEADPSTSTRFGCIAEDILPLAKSYATIDAAHGMDSRVHRVD